MFASDNTCCVCRERGKALQLHHIDENPSNNISTNLAVLCLECHNDTQLKGGFGRKLNAPLVTRYRDEWLERVVGRRTRADEQAVRRQVDPHSLPTPEPSAPEHIPREAPLAYINSLPAFRSELKKHAQPEWDSGVTSRMVAASYEYIDALQGILVTLAQYFSPQSFAGRSPQEFFADAIAARFRWHRAHSEPGGPGTGGTIVHVICVGNVTTDVERMIEELVTSLAGYKESFDGQGWTDRWRT
ncbi:HNH endonuclease [Acidovorax sp. ACV02]|uniref:HNH endonuclease signature motif containing protein n=1 Tax=Acidovorax sp. ACV02 TaxID=2769310 RepID=UPI00177DD8E4|nr:HNH endonuclease signature motif containing protein [Acidovorax sp. ACV02]MBD9405430.1 HNH endonuclease [Acidovorax sp. ACV02]